MRSAAIHQRPMTIAIHATAIATRAHNGMSPRSRSSACCLRPPRPRPRDDERTSVAAVVAEAETVTSVVAGSADHDDGWAVAYACVNCGANRFLSDACFFVRPDFTMNGLMSFAVYISDSVVVPGLNAVIDSSTVKSFVPLARSA